MSIEQISSGGTITYLHHDQQGSTRLLTGSTGTVTGKCTFGAYGAPTCEGASTTPLGYDAQYTSTDTSLIYMRARTYDPATAQFLTTDPINPLTRAPYNYAGDNPINFQDPSGLCRLTPGTSENCFSEVPNAVGSAIGSIAETAAEHPVKAAGIVLGGVALASGVGEVVGAGAAAGEAASLGTTSAVSGVLSAGADLKECIGGHDSAACIGTALGGASGLGAGLDSLGFIPSETVRSGISAIGIPSALLGLLTDIAGALDPSSSSASPGSAEGCG